MKKALKAAFKATMPVFFGYIFVGMAFGLLCQRNGRSKSFIAFPLEIP